MSRFQEYLMFKFGYLPSEVEDLTTCECIALISDLILANQAKDRV